MKAWTVLVYLAGDNGRFLSSLEGEGVADLLEMKEVGSNEAIDIVAQFDAMSDHACRRYHLSKGGPLAGDIVQDLGETNSGDAQVLLDFITWGVRSYPAQRYLLVLWNHGSGWKDDDIYVPYRALVRRGGFPPNLAAWETGQLPPIPPQISGRRCSRALFRRSLEAIIEEEANRVMISRGTRRGADEPTGQLPPGWTRPSGALRPLTRTSETPERLVVEVGRSARAPGARAICFDDSSKDFLDSTDLKDVLNAAVSVIGKKLDVLGLDACLMSMIEVAYQVRHAASVMVASEDAEPGSGWPYRDILTTLAEHPDMSAGDVGRAITIHYVRSYDRSYLTNEPVTQSALNLERVVSVVAALDELARGLLNGWRQKALRSAVADARAAAQSFVDPDYVDLYDFVSLLAARPGAKPLLDACDRLLTMIDPGKVGSLVLADSHAGLIERRAHGLSVYFPQVGLSPFYALLDMSRDCAWLCFLDTYLG